MICVSIGRTRHKMIILEHRALAERGAQLVELRLDWLSRLPDLGRLLKDRPTPVVVTIRRPSDRGRWRGSEEQRQMLLRQAIVDGAEYVDLEGDIATRIPRYGKTKRIVSHHDFDETPDRIEEIYAELCELDADIVKVVTMANTPGDAVRMLQIVADARKPTIAFAMGDLGTFSRILCGKYGAPFTYATFSADRELAPGQLSFDEMKNVYRYDSIGPQTRVFGLLGDPVAHSLSPLIHNAAFADAGLDAVYVPFRVPAHLLHETLKEFEWLEVHGYSVTIPHKEAVLQYADVLTDAVREIGAANTLVRQPDGRWFAHNTDAEAAIESILLGLGEDAPPDGSLHGRHVLLLGAGGVARAIGWAVVNRGAKLTIASRTAKRAARLAEQLGCTYVTWENRGSVAADILVNGTPVGMHPNVDESPYEAHWLREGMLVFDTVYNPERTLLLKYARERDCRTVSGIEMFVRQAAKQFELFTNHPAPTELMRRKIRQAISPVVVKKD